VYATGGFALLEAADLLLPLLQGPAWTFKALAAAYLLLLPVVLALAWLYDLTPEGLQRTAEASHVAAHPGVVLPLIFTASIVAAGFLGWRILAAGPGDSTTAVLPPDPSVAILPFVDMSPDQDQEHLADGIAEEILNALTRIEGLKVVARTSAFAFKGRNVDVREVARTLGVRHIVEGSVRRDGDRVRVTAELIDALDGFHLWSDTFEQPIRSIFAIEDAISRTVADSLRVAIGLPAPLEARAPTKSVEALESYYRGLFHWNRWTESGFERSLQYFRRAIELDPDFALPWAGIANAYSTMSFFGALSPSRGIPESKAAALKALALDSTVAEARGALVMAHLVFDWDWVGAERELTRVVDEHPGSALGHFALSQYYAALGQQEKVLEHIVTARELDPLSLPIANAEGWGLLGNGRIEEASRVAKGMIEQDAAFASGHWLLGIVSLARGDVDDATGILEEAVRLSGSMPFVSATLAQAYVAAGRLDRARDILRALESPPADGYVPATAVAIVYAALGDADATFESLERAFDERDGWLVFAAWWIGSLSSDPRMESLRRRMGLPPGKPLPAELEGVSGT